MRVFSTQFLMNMAKAIWSALEYPLTIVGKSKRNLDDYQIHGNSVQDGTPTPDAPVEVQSVGKLIKSGTYAGKYVVTVVIHSDTSIVASENIYLDAPLRYIGNKNDYNYADYIDYENKRVVRRVKELVVTGNESWNTQGGSYENDTTCFFACSFVNNRHTQGTWASNRDLCNMFPRRGSNIQSANIKTECFALHPTESYKGFAYFHINKSRLAGNTANDFKAWLKGLYNNGTPLKLYYALEEPVYEDIDLPSIYQLKGTTTYTTDTSVEPSGIQVKYY